MKKVILWCVLVLALVPAALAQTEVEGFLGFYDPGTEISQADLDQGLAVGVRIGQSFMKVFGTEFGYTAATSLKNKLGTFDETLHMFNGNFLVQLPAGAFVPFATIGFGGIVGQQGTNIEIRSVWTWNVGGGLKVRKLVGPVGFRFDVRFYDIPDGIELTPLPPDINRKNFNILEVSGGLLLTF